MVEGVAGDGDDNWIGLMMFGRVVEWIRQGFSRQLALLVK